MGFKQYLGELVGQAGLFHRNVSDDPVPSGTANPLPAALYGKGTNPGDTAVEMVQSTDNQSGTKHGALVYARPALWNGSGHDLQRGNTEGTLLASAARTATTNSANQTNHNARGVILRLLVTAVGTGDLRVRIYDAFTGAYTLHTFGPVTGDSLFVIYPGVTEDTSGASRVSRPLPRTWSASVVKSDASSWTYRLDYSLIL
jgi:hypothetical protein